MEFGVFLFLFRGLKEKGRNLLITFLLCDRGKERVLVPGLGLARKRFPQVLFVFEP